MEIKESDIQILFDLVVGSLDFGSGFLGEDDIHCLRRVARTLGVPTKVATDTANYRNFNHPYVALENPWREGQCADCYQQKDHGCHDNEMPEDL